jgi:RNA polymerase sigma factor (TIGR02999 family)
MTDGSSVPDMDPAGIVTGRDPVAMRALADQLVPLFYDELRRIARRVRGKVGGGATLQTTALVHETYFKLRGAHGWNDDLHFLNAAALAMRHVLVSHAIANAAAKRGAGARHLSLTAAEQMEVADDDTIVNLNEALDRLSAHAPRLAQVVECRYFGGYSEELTARTLQISERTVRRDWTLARAWLHRELNVTDEPTAN